jgi:ABC-2 type transport system ATP-binding protein
MDKVESVIHTQALSKSYRGLNVLENLDINIQPKRVVGFLGPNGSGKTSTLRILTGLSRPTSGKAWVLGMDVRTHGRNIRQRIGYLAQSPQFYDFMTARQILRYVAGFYPMGGRDWVEQRIAEVLGLVELEAKADRSIRGFSGGERQRLGIAQACLPNPELIILDEPTAALDPLGRRDVLEIIKSLRGHTTVFFSTHILEDVERISDEVVLLD